MTKYGEEFHSKFVRKDAEQNSEVFNLLAQIDSQGKIKSTFIASPYFTVDALKSIIKRVKQKTYGYNTQSCSGSFILLLDKNFVSHKVLSGQRNKESSEASEIRKINRKIKKIFKGKVGGSDSGIYLVSGCSLFHSKLYYFKRPQSTSTVLIGSANLTGPALDPDSTNVNEELLLELTPPSSKLENRVEEYFLELLSKKIDDKAKNDKNPIKLERLESFLEDPKKNRAFPQDLREFFLNGYLCYETEWPNLNFPWEFEKFFKISNPEELKKLEDIVVHSEMSFSLPMRTLIGAEKNEQSSDSSEKDKPKRILWKKYGVETNLGVWIPELFKDRVTEAIGLKESRREKFFEQLEKNVSNKIDTKFYQCLHKVLEVLGEKENVSAMDVQKWNESCIKRWENHVSRLKKILKNENLKTWYCTGILQTPMIDLWATENEGEFLETVYEYLSSRQNTALKNKFLIEFYKKKEFKVLHKWFEDKKKEEKKQAERNVKKQSE